MFDFVGDNSVPACYVLNILVFSLTSFAEKGKNPGSLLHKMHVPLFAACFYTVVAFTGCMLCVK